MTDREELELDLQSARRYVSDNLEDCTDHSNYFDVAIFERKLKNNSFFLAALIMVASRINDWSLDKSCK